MPRVLFFVGADWYFWSHRLTIARAARDAGYEVLVLTHVDRFGESMRQEGFTVVPIEFVRGFGSFFYELKAFLAVARAYRRVRPDLVHQVSPKCILYGSLAARLSGVRVLVNTLPGLGYLFTSRQWRSRLLRPFVTNAFRLLLAGRHTRVIVQNPDDRIDLARRRVVPERNLVLIRGSGVDTARFAPSPEPPSPVVFALVSRMLEGKGISEFVGAARILRETGAAARFVLVGGPDSQNPDSLKPEQLEAWNGQGFIEWWGKRDDVERVWAAAHVAVLPSYDEGIPKSLLEAAACGRPIVATDIPGCREIVRDGENGLLIPPRDAPALAAAMKRLIADAALRQSLGRRGREIVLAEFSDAIVAEKTMEVYRALLGSVPAAPAATPR